MNDRSFNNSLRWSNLAKFGKSKFGQLTLIVPALGYVIFFNSFVEEYLRPLQMSEGTTILHRLSEARLELLYLGLVIVGFSVAFFGMCAPQQIKDHNLFSKFMRNKLELMSNESIIFSLEKLTFPFTREQNLKWHRRYLFGLHLSPDYEAGFEKTILKIWTLGHKKHEEHEEPVCNTEKDAFVERLRSCLLLPDDIEALEAGALDFPADVFRYEYIFVEFMSFPVRAAIFGLFLIGILISISPTLVTSLLVLEKLNDKIW